MTVSELAKRANQLAKQWSKIRSQALEDTKEIALDMITDDQLFDQGIDGRGQKLPEYRSPEYEAIKARMNPNRVPDLRFTGDWTESIYSTIQGDDTIIQASDSKDAKLTAKYGPDIKNLTKENTKRYALENVLPVLQDYRDKILGIG